MIASWPCPSADGTDPEYAVAWNRGRPRHVLIVPALFDESNRLRRFTLDLMRALDGAGIDSTLPDLPGTNESLRPLCDQTLAGWRAAMQAAADHLGATHVLSLRGGALVAPDRPGWGYAPLSGGSLLRQLLRGRVLGAREAGREETQEGLMAQGLLSGLTLAGYSLSSRMIAELQHAEPAAGLAVIGQHAIGGAGLWLRAEPDEALAQSQALAHLVAGALAT